MRKKVKNGKLWIISLIAVGGFMLLNDKRPLGIRNNNAGNIRATGNWQQWQGAIGKRRGFIIFDSPENGLRAMARILKTYRDVHGLNTIDGILNRWAPPIENNTLSYIRHAENYTKVNRFYPLSEIDYPLLMSVMTLHENGVNPYSAKQFQIGMERGFV